MNQYLLSIYQPKGDPPPADVLAEVMRDVRAVDEQLRAAGAWVFSGGLHAPSAATVLDPRSEEMPMTEGPYVEGKVHIGGLTIIRASNLDVSRRSPAACSGRAPCSMSTAAALR